MFTIEDTTVMAGRIKAGMNCRVFLFGSYAWGRPNACSDVDQNARFDFEKYVRDGHLQGDFDRAVAKAAAEAKALGLPAAGLDRLGKRMLSRDLAKELK